MNILSLLKKRFYPVLAELVSDPDVLLEMIRPSQDPKFGDYQVNCAMPLGKQLGKPPREVAEEIVAQLQITDLCEDPEIAGPGFINLRIKNTWIVEQLMKSGADKRLGIVRVDTPRKFVIDFSSPNVAKPMHVGHIRSTVIGDALTRSLRFLGHEVISDNHLGDWGTQFGMIIYGFKHFAIKSDYERQPVDELSRLYKLVNQLIEYHQAKAGLADREDHILQLEQRLNEFSKAMEEAGRQKDKKAKKDRRSLESQLADAREKAALAKSIVMTVESDQALATLAAKHAEIGSAVLSETAKLHSGDEENRQLWHEFLPHCRADMQRIYDRLGVVFNVEHGESFYHEQLESVVTSLVSRGLARESEGAICMFLEGFKAPFIIRKKDGAFLYATTDLATIQFRMLEWEPDAILYVVDHRQSEHFDKLFFGARQWGHNQVELTHISFGTVLGEDGKPFKTRSGAAVGLESLLDEAVNKALSVVSENDERKPNGPELKIEERQRIAAVVGHAAIKYADLSHNRTSDYVFSYDKMMALEGNTATYMQYSYARVQSIFARGHIDVDALRTAGTPLEIAHAAERALALELLRFSEALQEVATDYRPNHLTNYLFELAKKYSVFFEHCPVLKADGPQQRQSRLRLCDLTARTIQLGLELLGIDVVDRM